MTDFHPWQSRPKRHRIDKGWIVAIAAIVLLVAAMTLIWGNAESAGHGCRAERAAWRAERAAAVRIGGHYPGNVATAWAIVRQCEQGQRER